MHQLWPSSRIMINYIIVTPVTPGYGRICQTTTSAKVGAEAPGQPSSRATKGMGDGNPPAGQVKQEKDPEFITTGQDMTSSIILKRSVKNAWLTCKKTRNMFKDLESTLTLAFTMGQIPSVYPPELHGTSSSHNRPTSESSPLSRSRLFSLAL